MQLQHSSQSFCDRCLTEHAAVTQVGLDPLTITPTGGKAAAVTFTDFIACAAIEHVLDTVLLPKSVSPTSPFAPSLIVE